MEDKKIISKNIKQYSITIATIVLTSFVSSAFTYSILTNKTSSNLSGSNVKYEISNVESPVIAIAKKTSPSIVGVTVKSMTQGVFGDLQDSGSEGSGIIYSDDGYIITNYHVISSALNNTSATVTVNLPNEKDAIEAKIIGGDKVTDLAVLKIDKTKLQKAEIGISKDILVGDIAVAIGNPLGQEFAGSVTSGIISAVNRKVTTEGRTYNLIQTDAAINPGNSGGALVNSKGQVIGINSIKIGTTGVEGLGFAIPIDEAKPIIDELILNKKIVRPYIGLSGSNLDKKTAIRYELVEGIYIQDVSLNTPASKATIKKGDIITEVDGKTIITMEELNEYKNTKKVGDVINIKVYRLKKYIDIKITLEEDTVE